MRHYIPRKGDRFHAVLKVEDPDKTHICGPFTCTKAEPKKIEAENDDGAEWIFYMKKFSFEKVDE